MVRAQPIIVMAGNARRSVTTWTNTAKLQPTDNGPGSANAQWSSANPRRHFWGGIRPPVMRHRSRTQSLQFKSRGARMAALTLLEPRFRFGDKPLKFQLVCPQNGTAVLKGLRFFILLYRNSKHSLYPDSRECTLTPLEPQSRLGTKLL